MARDPHDRGGTAGADRRPGELEVAVYPARMGRAGDGRPSSPARAYRLPDDPARAAEAARTADSRRTVARTLTLPPAPVLPEAPRPAPPSRPAGAPPPHPVERPPGPPATGAAPPRSPAATRDGRGAFARGEPPAARGRRGRAGREQHTPRHRAPRWYHRLAALLLPGRGGDGAGSG